jgi:hypothetical protein
MSVLSIDGKLLIYSYNQYINHMSRVIVLNPEEKLRLDYEHNWKNLVTYEDYLDIIAQRESFLCNELGYEASK